MSRSIRLTFILLVLLEMLRIVAALVLLATVSSFVKEEPALRLASHTLLCVAISLLIICATSLILNRLKSNQVLRSLDAVRLQTLTGVVLCVFSVEIGLCLRALVNFVAWERIVTNEELVTVMLCFLVWTIPSVRRMFFGGRILDWLVGSFRTILLGPAISLCGFGFWLWLQHVLHPAIAVGLIGCSVLVGKVIAAQALYKSFSTDENADVRQTIVPATGNPGAYKPWSRVE